jgi:molecular chaperone GrpE (heat shock protein)
MNTFFIVVSYVLYDDFEIEGVYTDRRFAEDAQYALRKYWDGTIRCLRSVDVIERALNSSPNSLNEKQGLNEEAITGIESGLKSLLRTQKELSLSADKQGDGKYVHSLREAAGNILNATGNIKAWLKILKGSV